MYVVRYKWMGEWHRTMPMAKPAAVAAAREARDKFPVVEVVPVGAPCSLY